jgi:Tfp pilus assembly protein PilV
LGHVLARFELEALHVDQIQQQVSVEDLRGTRDRERAGQRDGREQECEKQPPRQHRECASDCAVHSAMLRFRRALTSSTSLF